MTNETEVATAGWRRALAVPAGWIWALLLAVATAVIGGVSAYNGATIAAASTRNNTLLTWQTQLLDEQRKSLQLAAAEYVSVLIKGIARVQKVTAGEALQGIHLTHEQYLAYDLELRQDIAAANVAAMKLYIESPKTATALGKIHAIYFETSKNVDAMYLDEKLDRRAERWKQLNDTLTNLDFRGPLDSVRADIARPTINLGELGFSGASSAASR